MRKCQVQEAQQEIAAMLAGEGRFVTDGNRWASSQQWRSFPKIPEIFGVFPERC
jgi:hypothetical protein